MAVTAVSARITPAGAVTPVGPSVAFFSSTGSTPPAFPLTAGRYAVQVTGSTFGTVTLELLGPDGVTYLPVGNAFAANGVQFLDLPTGTYQLVLA